MCVNTTPINKRDHTVDAQSGIETEITVDAVVAMKSLPNGQ